MARGSVRTSESNIKQAIYKAMVEFNRGRRDMEINDLMMAEQIERELEKQGLLKPQGCDCRVYERGC